MNRRALKKDKKTASKVKFQRFPLILFITDIFDNWG